MINNTARTASLTLADKDDDTSLVNQTAGSTAKIATQSTGKPADGTAGWAVSVDGGTTFKAMPKAGDTSLVVSSKVKGKANTDKNVQYAVATDDSQEAGVYKDVVTYTFTQDAQY